MTNTPSKSNKKKTQKLTHSSIDYASLWSLRMKQKKTVSLSDWLIPMPPNEERPSIPLSNATSLRPAPAPDITSPKAKPASPLVKPKRMNAVGRKDNPAGPVSEDQTTPTAENMMPSTVKKAKKKSKKETEKAEQKNKLTDSSPTLQQLISSYNLSNKGSKNDDKIDTVNTGIGACRVVTCSTSQQSTRPPMAASLSVAITDKSKDSLIKPQRTKKIKKNSLRKLGQVVNEAPPVVDLQARVDLPFVAPDVLSWIAQVENADEEGSGDAPTAYKNLPLVNSKQEITVNMKGNPAGKTEKPQVPLVNSKPKSVVNRECSPARPLSAAINPAQDIIFSKAKKLDLKSEKIAEKRKREIKSSAPEPQTEQRNPSPTLEEMDTRTHHQFICKSRFDHLVDQSETLMSDTGTATKSILNEVMSVMERASNPTGSGSTTTLEDSAIVRAKKYEQPCVRGTYPREILLAVDLRISINLCSTKKMSICHKDFV